MKPRRPARGFTLIELMIVVAIIGILASVALPSYQLVMLRSRAAERGVILRSTAVGLEDYVMRAGTVPGGLFAGGPNPPGAVTPHRRVFNNGMPGWRDVNVLTQGDCFYTYEFEATEPAGGAARYWISAVGDLDGDGVFSPKLRTYVRTSGVWVQVAAGTVPPDGMEDINTF